jgi:hypothetical protein
MSAELTVTQYSFVNLYTELHPSQIKKFRKVE